MQTLQIDEQQARKLYKTASPEFKQVLHDTFGTAFFSEKITDRVKTHADALNVLGKNYRSAIGLTTDEVAYRQLKDIAEALNEGWTPDWNNSSQQKWWNWFRFDAPGFRFGVAYYYYARSSVGSRLCFRSRELAEYAAAQFLDLYKAYLTA